jgi:hypothetical protein
MSSKKKFSILTNTSPVVVESKSLRTSPRTPTTNNKARLHLSGVFSSFFTCFNFLKELMTKTQNIEKEDNFENLKSNILLLKHFQTYLEKINLIQYFKLHESIEKFKKKNFEERKVLFHEMKQKYENFNLQETSDYSTSMFDELDQSIVSKLKNEIWPEFMVSEQYFIYCEEMLRLKSLIPEEKKRNSLPFKLFEKKQPKVKISTPTSVSHQSHIGYESNSEQYKEKYNFDEFMNNPDSLIRKYFKKSLENLYCAENFYFHEGVEIYRILHDEKDIVNQANYLWNTFLDPKSKYELNITKLERDSVLDRIIQHPKDLFDKLDKEILLTLKNENYGKFLTSEEFKQFLKEKDGKITFFEF